MSIGNAPSNSTPPEEPIIGTPPDTFEPKFQAFMNWFLSTIPSEWAAKVAWLQSAFNGIGAELDARATAKFAELDELDNEGIIKDLIQADRGVITRRSANSGPNISGYGVRTLGVLSGGVHSPLNTTVGRGDLPDTVLINSADVWWHVPINAGAYQNNAQLLTAMLKVQYHSLTIATPIEETVSFSLYSASESAARLESTDINIITMNRNDGKWWLSIKFLSASQALSFSVDSLNGYYGVIHNNAAFDIDLGQLTNASTPV